MPVDIACPQCERAGKVPETYLGKNVSCPRCRHSFLVAETPTAETSATYQLSPDSRGGSCHGPMTEQKRRALHNYATVLGPALRDRYGEQPYYLPQAIRDTALYFMLDFDYICFAYCMFACEADFTRHHESIGEVCDYDGMRSVVADTLYAGNLDFDVTTPLVETMAAASDVAGEMAGEAGSWLAEAGSLVTDADWSGLFG